ncbi:MAG: BamA/TamA family outer membrane protein [Chitinophagaceae bacterium]|nr:BamA/TamA family outer membrane protein [Chitinophagaceae bacterium]
MMFRGKKNGLSLIRYPVLWILVFGFSLSARSQYRLNIRFAGKDSAFDPQAMKWRTDFSNRSECLDYIKALPAQLSGKGYPTASVDSVFEKENSADIILYTGKKYKWVSLRPVGLDKKATEASGFSEKSFIGKPLNMLQLQQVQERLLVHYENNGYPFASVFLDSIKLDDDKMDALLLVKKGPLYHLDSIQLFGKARISKKFLQHYLNLPRGGLFNKDNLEQVDKKILDLPYLQALQPSELVMLGTGSILKLFLAPKRSSQFNFLIGVLPNSGQSGKLQVTADVNLDLKNALGSGETIFLKWQQLQTKSPRLNLGYQQPYIFNSSFGIDFGFDLFKKDSSFLQVNAQLGVQYLLSAYQSGKVFFQWQNSFLLGGAVDTQLVIATKKLPPNIDVSSSSLGLDYDWVKTDYRLNPRKGNEIRLILSAGIKNIKRNSDITNIKDPGFNYASLYDSLRSRSYQFRVRLSAAHFFPVGKQATVKTAFSGGLFSSQNIFRNELFQIGGYKLMRGFSEESIYATQFAVATAEYRYRLALNSYLFGFVDGGLVKNKYQAVKQSNQFIGAGLGLVFETRFGLLNISYAAGKRDDVKFSFREGSKIHFGYVNYF